MNKRRLAGAVAAYVYNHWLTNVPSRLIRSMYLSLWLASLPKDAGIQMGCRFLNGRKIHLGERNVINFGTLLDGRRYPIRVGNDVSIGPEAAILTLGHDPQSPDFADRGGEVVIGDQVWICFRSIILPGVTIGEGAVVAAGAIVSRDVEPYSIVAGSPAKPVGTRTKNLRYRCEFAPWLV